MDFETNNVESNVEERRQCRGMIHVVESGDTLYLIGKKYNVSVSDIMRNNPYVNVYNLQIGDELCIPTKNIGMVQGFRPYVVKEDDTLKSILNQAGVDFETLMRYNQSLGQLKVPEKTVILVPINIMPKER